MVSAESKDRVDAIAARALTRLRAALGHDPDVGIRFELIRGDTFQAEATLIGNDVVVAIGRGAVNQTDGLWAAIWDVLKAQRWNELHVTGGKQHSAPGSFADLSLEWLILHEVTHGLLGHLPLLGTASLVEVGIERPAAVTNDDAVIRLDRILTSEELPRARLCLEMQADNEAAEIFFGPFRDADWPELRVKTACIVVVMALIERATAQNGTSGVTHPMASTRFFMLLAQLSQYWLYKDARLETDGTQSWVRTAEPPDMELYRCYREEVIEPAILDAAHIAEGAQAGSLIADLRSPLALLSDLFEAQYAEDLATANLQTAAARQWRELLPINEKIMTAMGHRD